MAKEPASLYNQCLLAYVKNLNHNVASLDRIAELRHLPTAILATVYEQVSVTASLPGFPFPLPTLRRN